jgi:Zn-finger nucleic acid-binding protein
MDRERRGKARYWRCGRCGAHAMAESALRKVIPAPLWKALWPELRGAATPGSRECPACGRPMDETRDLVGAEGMRLDFCDTCRLVWLDPRELDRLPKTPVAEETALPPEAAKLLAKAYAAEYDEREQMVFGVADLAIRAFVAFLSAFGRR